MTFLPKLEGNYQPLKVYIAEADRGLRGPVERAAEQWNWEDPERRSYLPDLVTVVHDPAEADVVVHWVKEVDDVLLASGESVVLKDSAYGCTITNTATGKVDIFLDKFMHLQLGPGWRIPVALHEIGHALGLRHEDATIPNGIMQRGLVDVTEGHGFRMVTQQERELARDLRVLGVVGVDSLVGN